MNSELDIRFQKAVELANKMSQSNLPQDIQLRLYASYKQAISGTTHPKTNYLNYLDLRSAFKMNAWLQISHLSQDEAKEMYISLINECNNTSI